MCIYIYICIYSTWASKLMCIPMQPKQKAWEGAAQWSVCTSMISLPGGGDTSLETCGKLLWIEYGLRMSVSTKARSLASIAWWTGALSEMWLTDWLLWVTVTPLSRWRWISDLNDFASTLHKWLKRHLRPNMQAPRVSWWQPRMWKPGAFNAYGKNFVLSNLRGGYEQILKTSLNISLWCNLLHS